VSANVIAETARGREATRIDLAALERFIEENSVISLYLS
jgi:hypothetical protein